jgi:hypothetical protein
MKLNQIQVCLDCEEAYVGDYCPKCGSVYMVIFGWSLLDD